MKISLFGRFFLPTLGFSIRNTFLWYLWSWKVSQTDGSKATFSNFSTPVFVMGHKPNFTIVSAQSWNPWLNSPLESCLSGFVLLCLVNWLIAGIRFTEHFLDARIIKTCGVQMCSDARIMRNWKDLFQSFNLFVILS